MDPLAKMYSFNSPFAFSENSTIAYLELEGLEKISYTVYKIQKGDTFIGLENEYSLPNGLLSEINIYAGKHAYPWHRISVIDAIFVIQKIFTRGKQLKIIGEPV